MEVVKSIEDFWLTVVKLPENGPLLKEGRRGPDGLMCERSCHATRTCPILLVEDNLGDARLLREMLVDAGPGGFAVDHAGSLAEAFRLLDRAVVPDHPSGPQSAGQPRLRDR